jgi:hypothetical protein
MFLDVDGDIIVGIFFIGIILSAWESEGSKETQIEAIRRDKKAAGSINGSSPRVSCYSDSPFQHNFACVM